MRWKNLNKWEYLVIAQLLIIYVVGIIGLNSTQASWFASLTPLNLLVSFVIILPFTSNFKKLSFYFILAFSLGMVAEIIGVAFGFPFGNYV
ncbi:MAG: hypothetical protein LRY32_06655, partial [Flavobacterium sp.]|nr:hypothetical protein [Flavobacterium sp.]